MPDPVSPTDTTAPAATVIDPQPATPPAPSVKTFTQEEVDQIVKSRLERSQRKPDPTPAPRAEPQKLPGAEPAAASPSLADIDRRIAQAEDFATLATSAGLDLDQKRIARSMLAAANPADVSTWWKETIEPLKLGKQPAPPAVQPAASAAPAATPATEMPKPAAAPSAPSAHTLPTANGVVDLFNLSQPQLQALGPSGVRENLEKLWAIGNQMSGAPARPKPPSQR